MARPYRILVPGGLYHVIGKATGWDRLFVRDRDRAAFLRVFTAVVARLHWRCRICCLLGTHYHLMLETPEPNLDRGMQRLNGSYAQWFNREYERTGHLFGDRYHSVLVERESHARELVRYIARNPVRAGLCKRPEDWPWSSYAATLGLAPKPAFLDCDELLSWFAPQRAAAIRRLKAFVDGS